MTRLAVMVLALVLCAAVSRAQETRAQKPRAQEWSAQQWSAQEWSAQAKDKPDCPVPNYMLFGDSPLERVSAAAAKNKALKIVVVGGTSSTLPGRDGATIAYPARLEAALKKRLKGVDVTVVSRVKPRQTAEEMADSLEKVLLDEKPDLVVWQTGTFDALQGVDPEQFRANVAYGVETVQAGGADIILMNMQYSPRTDAIIAFGGYADNMRWVAREHEVPLFDRLAVMRYWHDSGTIDLYAATKDVGVAKRVHDCIGQAVAAVVVEAARLEAFEGKASSQ